MNSVNVVKVPVVSFSILSDWHTGPAAPNGSVCGQTERYIRTVHIYSADYYGRGSKLYMRTRVYLQFPNGSMSHINTSDDGNERYIRAMIADHCG